MLYEAMIHRGHGHTRPHAVHTTRCILYSVCYILALTSLKYVFNFSMFVSDAGQLIPNPSCWFGLGI